MADNKQEKYSHIVLQNNGNREDFVSPSRGGGSSAIPERDRQSHGTALIAQVQQLKTTLTQAAELQRYAGMDEGFGLQIEFESFPDIELAFESLARERSGIELRNVRYDENKVLATVFVPEGKLTFFEKLILAYLDEGKDTEKGPKNRKLLNAIAEIRAATLQSLWTDTPESMPVSDTETLWWEVWLPVKKDRQAVTAQFREMAESLGFELAAGELIFPERTVLLVYGSVGQMKRSMMTLNSIAELRRAKETADFFDSLAPSEQPEWADELNARLSISTSGANVPYICILDTGVNNGHPLLHQALENVDLHTVEPSWGVTDQHGHGTEMAGVALFGNLTDALATTQPITIEHRLESVKLLPSNGANSSNAQHHGYLTEEAVSRPAVMAPNRKRLFSMAVTAKDNRDRGRPSAWSASIDRITSDAGEQGEDPKLFIVSAGNVNDPNAWLDYPDSNTTDGIHDPAQAWNALTVGAMTNLEDITELDARHYQPIAPFGGLSPFSTTSQAWDSHWPLKPDVVFEGGNAAKDGIGAAWMHSLSVLTTNANVSDRLFTTTRATSAASAAAARMAAQLMGHYPELWPETIRGLIVHSAEWTQAMKDAFLPSRGRPSKADIAYLVRHCGFGEPSLERALWSANNSLTLVCEDYLHPFMREGSDAPKYKDMHLHNLPWPLDELESLGNTEVEMRVTLSYFIEPNPSARGVTSRYRYESHGLRFEVKRPLESTQSFRARINAKAREDEAYTPSGDSDPAWVVGTSNRHKGSLHSDIWKGSAAELASRGEIAIYPSTGWWKSRQALKQYERAVRYSLIVSIKAPEVDVDLYTPIANKVSLPILLPV